MLLIGYSHLAYKLMNFSLISDPAAMGLLSIIIERIVAENVTKKFINHLPLSVQEGHVRIDFISLPLPGPLHLTWISVMFILSRQVEGKVTFPEGWGEKPIRHLDRGRPHVSKGEF